MTENVELKQSVTGWKDEVLSGSGAPLSLEEAAFTLSAGIFGAVLAYSASSHSGYFLGLLPSILLVAVGGAAGAASGRCRAVRSGGCGAFGCRGTGHPRRAVAPHRVSPDGREVPRGRHDAARPDPNVTVLIFLPLPPSMT